MKTFDYSNLKKLKLDLTFVNLISRIDAFKLNENQYINNKFLKTLNPLVLRQSTFYSSKQEGIETLEPRFKRLLTDDELPNNHDEEQIIGYFNNLKTIFETYDIMQLSINNILYLHKELINNPFDTRAGKIKNAQNQIIKKINNIKIVVFAHPDPYTSSVYLEKLINAYNENYGNNNIHPLIKIVSFIFDFNCIHPFYDGNGRISRLLLNLLLLKEGYNIGKYVSLEKIIYDTKNQYYDALEASNPRWYNDEEDITPILKYILNIVLKAYLYLQESIVPEITNDDVKDLPLKYQILYRCEQFHHKFSTKELLNITPNYKKSTIINILNILIKEGWIIKQGLGKSTKYYRTNKNFNLKNLKLTNDTYN